MEKTIFKKLFEMIDISTVIAAIYYGNKKGNDVDVFLILKGEMIYGCFKKEFFDITCVGEYYINSMLENFDPLVTEPFLTGEVIYGNIGVYKAKLDKSKPNSKMFHYLIKSAKAFYFWAEDFYSSGNYKEMANNLRFVVSYLIFAEHYSRDNKVITFNQLIDLYPNELLMQAKKFTKINVKKEELFELLKSTAVLLTKYLKKL